MIQVWVYSSFALALALVLATFRRYEVTSPWPRAMLIFARCWYFGGFIGWSVSGRQEHLMGAFLVGCAGHVLPICIRRTVRPPSQCERSTE